MDPAQAAAFWEANADTWTRHVRAGYDVYRDAHNTPAFLGMLPPIAGLGGLDIGCGEGANTRQLARLGARITAIDVAPTFLRHAQSEEDASPLGIHYQLADAQALPFEDAAFDFATAFMSLMDMPDAPRALAEAARILRPGGFLQFSILHPCFVPPHRRVLREPDGAVRAIELAGYFDCVHGELIEWWFSTLPTEERSRVEPFRTPIFHRTLSQWVDFLCRAGLVIEQLGEPRATPQQAAAQPVLADTLVAPLFLHIRARKPA